MKNEFYPIVYRTRYGNIDMIGRMTRKAALNQLRRLQDDYNVVKVMILDKGKHPYQETIDRLTEMKW